MAEAGGVPIRDLRCMDICDMVAIGYNGRATFLRNYIFVEIGDVPKYSVGTFGIYVSEFQNIESAVYDSVDQYLKHIVAEGFLQVVVRIKFAQY